MAFQSQSITGSLWGTSSFAVTASWGVGTFNNFTGSAGIQGDLDINNYPVAPTCVLVARPNNTTPTATGNIPFANYTIIGTGSIAFDGTIFTLTGGKSYEIEVVLGTDSYSSAFAQAQVNIQTVTGNINTQNNTSTQTQRGYLIPFGAGQNFTGNKARWIATAIPATTSTGAVVITGITTSFRILSNNSYLIIRQTSK